jgi:hypothetical protein
MDEERCQRLASLISSSLFADNYGRRANQLVLMDQMGHQISQLNEIDVRLRIIALLRQEPSR